MSTPAHMQTLSGTPSTLGRFELKKVLGRGAQAGVWLAHDPRLQRDVALKLLHSPADGSGLPGAQQWLQEARNTSRLAHPHIVTLFEADVFDGRPGLVLELVDGPTLAQRLHQVGALPAEQAASIALQVLGALQHAHDQGVVHRDLKPSNILLDASGNAKVTDFGIATRMQAVAAAGSAAQGSGIEGSPGYLSPEAARGEPPRPVNDVFACGLVLGEMLLGHPLVAETDPYRAIYRVAHEDLQLPQDAEHPVDDALRAVVQRALARDPALRYASADDMAHDVRAWMNALPDSAESTGTEATGSATLEFLLRRMRRTSDFPAMSAQILRVQSLASSENESLNSLTSEILKDVALTNKLLRIVNSAHFSHVGGGSINTVSRAVSLVGFAGIRNVAMSLVLLDHMENKAHANQLKGEFLRSLMAASLAAELAPHQRGDTEELFIGALFQNLGRMLTEFYFPDEAQQVRRAMASPASASEERASTTVLGISYEALGQGVGRAWGLPPTMLNLMRKPGVPPPGRIPTDPTERMHWQTLAANELADVFLKVADGDVTPQLQKVAARYAACLGQSSDTLTKTTLLARDKLAASADAIGLRVPDHSPADRLLRTVKGAAGGTAASGEHTLQANAAANPADAAAAALQAPTIADRANQTASLLATGVQDVTNAMVADDFRLNDVLRMILETMYRAMGFRQVLFCLKDAHSDALVGRLGLGEGATEAAHRFKVGLHEPNNLFTVVCNKGVDTLIHDAHAPKVASNLPDWYRQHINARSFMMLPLLLKGAPMGLIYADQMQADSIALDDKGLALLKTLRNQAVMAFRQVRS